MTFDRYASMMLALESDAGKNHQKLSTTLPGMAISPKLRENCNGHICICPGKGEHRQGKFALARITPSPEETFRK